MIILKEYWHKWCMVSREGVSTWSFDKMIPYIKLLVKIGNLFFGLIFIKIVDQGIAMRLLYKHCCHSIIQSVIKWATIFLSGLYSLTSPLSNFIEFYNFVYFFFGLFLKKFFFMINNIIMDFLIHSFGWIYYLVISCFINCIRP